MTTAVLGMTAFHDVFGPDSIQSAMAASLRSSLRLELTSSPEFTVFTDSIASPTSLYLKWQNSHQFFVPGVLDHRFAGGWQLLFATVDEKVHLSIDSPTLASLAARSSKTVFG